MLTVEAEEARDTVVAPEQRTVQRLNEVLAAAHGNGQRMSVTWLNHFSAPQALDRAADHLPEFDIVGVDGKLLQLLLGGRSRTSADLSIPDLLPRLRGARVALIGGSPETRDTRVAKVTRLLGSAGSVVLSCDGYAGLPDPESLELILRATRANVVIVGLGAGLQEQYATAARAALVDGGLSLTCGGFLDQLLVENYYPAWAYPLRLNWLVRLAREPRRLWRRYTVDALTAVGQRARLARVIWLLPGLWV